MKKPLFDTTHLNRLIEDIRKSADMIDDAKASDVPDLIVEAFKDIATALEEVVTLLDDVELPSGD